MEIKRAAIVGAGAVGAYVISYLQKYMGEDFIVLAEGERRERLAKNGLCVNGEKIALNVMSYHEAGAVELVLLATKYGDFPGAVENIRPLLTEHTVVVSLLNGISSEALAASVVGEERILPAFMRIVSHREGNNIVFDPDATQGVVFGERDGVRSARVTALAALFDAAGVHYEISGDIVTAQWNKFAINLSNNLLQAVAGVGYGAYFDSEHLGYLHRRIMDEVTAAARAEGIELTSIPTPRTIAAPGARFSTLQDLDAKRPTETDMFLGVLLEIAEKHGLPLPYCDYTYHILKTLEEKNLGRFDY